MHFGIDLINFGDYAEARRVAELAQLAEASGWEGLFVWDHLAFVWGFPSGDPWVLLTAAALATSRLRLGTAITPLPRRRPQVLAQTLTTLDQLSGGRMILGVGLGGVEQEFTAFGEPGEAKARAAMLDEGLEVLDRLMSGEPVTHHGQYYTVEGVRLAPPPVQRPRIPIWVGGSSRRALRRSLCWDGWLPDSADQTQITMKPEQLAEQAAFIRQERKTDTPFEIGFLGYSTRQDRALVSEYASAGVTWWMECLHGLRGSFDEMAARIKAGPPV